MDHACWFAISLLVATAISVAQPPGPPQFRDGDVVAFIGDSITHSRKFHRYIYDYTLTRFPERKVRFVNCGIAGDSAGGAVSRLDWDILPNRPNVASLMLGMNDVGRGYYGKDNPDEANLAARQSALDSHRRNMETLARRLLANGVLTLIFCTPSPYDDTGDIPTENLFGVNAALGTCGEYARNLALQFGGSIVDFHGPMTALNIEKQKTDPKFTIIGQDRVHPGDVGQMVMAYLYLKAQGVPALVSSVSLDGVAGTVVECANAEVSEVDMADGRIAFTIAAKALPMPVEDSAKPALELVPLIQDLNQEILQVKLEGAGRMSLAIDGEKVGEYSREELAAGVNLATNPATPQYKQAREVVALNDQRSALEVRIRSWAQIRMMLMRAKIDEGDDAAIQTYFDDFLAKNSTPAGPNPYFAGQFKNYLATRGELESLRARIEELQQQVWQKNQPVPHRYELAPVAE